MLALKTGPLFRKHVKWFVRIQRLRAAADAHSWGWDGRVSLSGWCRPGWDFFYGAIPFFKIFRTLQSGSESALKNHM